MIRLKHCLFALAGLFLFVQAQPAHAQFDWGGEKVIKIKNLPNRDEYRVQSGVNKGRYIDIGAVYKQVRILFIPVWNYDVRWAGYVGTDDTYQKVSEDDLRDAADEAGVRMPRDIELPFWDAWGGKLVVGGIILLIAGISVFSRLAKRRRPAPAY